MRLTELEGRFIGAGGNGIMNADRTPAEERTGIGVMFKCPCGCEIDCFVTFKNPLDGKHPVASMGQPVWDRTGDTIETLTLRPSIYRTPEKGGCGWHGFITNGEVHT